MFFQTPENTTSFDVFDAFEGLNQARHIVSGMSRAVACVDDDTCVSEDEIYLFHAVLDRCAAVIETAEEVLKRELNDLGGSDTVKLV